eukprot:7926403-Heterocapsa_arctica.AAC.1
MYYASTDSKRRALVLRAELWRRAAFGSAFRGLLQRFGPGLVDFQEGYLSYDDMASYALAVLARMLRGG